MKSCTASQLTLIQALRKELGLKPLNTYEVKCLTINSASVMISDLQIIKHTIQSMGGIA